MSNRSVSPRSWTGAAALCFVALNGTLARQLETLDSGDVAPNEPMNRAFAAVCNELKTAVSNWSAMQKQDLPAFNAIVSKNGGQPVAAASSPLAAPACGPSAIGAHARGSAPH